MVVESFLFSYLVILNCLQLTHSNFISLKNVSSSNISLNDEYSNFKSENVKLRSSSVYPDFSNSLDPCKASKYFILI